MRACCALVLATAAVGCNFTVNAASDADGPRDARADTSRDVGSDGPLDAQCFDGPYGIHVCIQGGLSGTIHVTGDLTIDTDVTQDALPGTASCASLATGTTTVACVLAASTFTIDAAHTLNATGTLPLVVLADMVQVDGVIDVASHNGIIVGPMSNPTSCDLGVLPTAGDAGGGAGGSYTSAGGDGGNQDNVVGTTGGAAGATMAPAFAGGCNGQPGGEMGGAGGAGGGAIAIVATTSITTGTSGAIDASGGGGGGAPANDADQGGGGGGSGGTIAMQSPAITNDGQVFANGAGGGAGCNLKDAGSPGGEPVDATTRPPGGTTGAGAGGAGNGGAGYYAGHQSGPGARGTNNNDGGGGGGGGAGVVFASTKPGGGGDISPPVTTP